MRENLYKTFQNPCGRQPLRADFPAMTEPTGQAEKLVAIIKAELEKKGVTWDKAGRINIAFPQKDRELFPHRRRNRGLHQAHLTKKELEMYAPHIEWALAEGLLETRDLDRRGNQSSLHALTGQQAYRFDPSLQIDHFPFAESGSTEDHYFIVVDHTSEQGTTLANLINWITVNGGTVLAAAADNDSLTQRRTGNDWPLEKPLRAEFSDAAANTGRLAELASAFALSAEQDNWKYKMRYGRPTPNNCLDAFDTALHRLGLSVQALTDRECVRLIQSIGEPDHKNHQSFLNLMLDLRRAEKHQPRQP